jgi:hypothetical protein
MEHPMIAACRRPGSMLSTGQLAEAVKDGLPDGSVISFHHSKVTAVVSGFVFTAPSVEAAIVAAADALKF